MRKNQDGFGAVVVLLILVVVGLLGTALVVVENSKKSTIQLSNNSGNVQPVSPSPDGSAVLTGIVSEGPTGPVCREGQSCTGVVANHDIVVLDSSGKTIASTKTDGNGIYTVTLPQGQYSLKLVPHIGISDLAYKVTVGAGTTHYNITADTGIR